MKLLCIRIFFLLSFFSSASQSLATPVLRSDGVSRLLVAEKYLVDLRIEPNLPLAVYPENGASYGWPPTDESILARVDGLEASPYRQLAVPILEALAALINSTAESDRPTSINGCGAFSDYPSCYVFIPYSIEYQLSPYTPAFLFTGAAIEIVGTSRVEIGGFGVWPDEFVGGTLTTLGIIDSVTFISAPDTSYLMGLGFVLLAVSVRRGRRQGYPSFAFPR